VSSPLISIGMPVYNGGEDLRRALESILAQTHAGFEVIISDNASTDGLTRELTEEYARRDARIRLTRQPANLDILANFLWVLEQARGEYFMWAAHDDAWSPNFVERLAKALDGTPDAALATPATCVERSSPTGGLVRLNVPAAPNGDLWKTLDVFFRDNICVWIYGMYRTAWLRQAAPELGRYPHNRGDRFFLYGLILSAPVVGDASATFYYSDAPRKRDDYSADARIKFLWLQVYFLTQLSFARLRGRDRFNALRRVAAYIYRHQISRHNPVGTLVRFTKLAMLSAYFGLEAGLQRLAGPRYRGE
jgi:glycosyltransferase involved in cell wall biosynthesis